MNFARVLESGLAGASTLTLLQETLHKMDGSAPRPLLHKSGILKKLKKSSNKGASKKARVYTQLAGEVLANAALFGLPAIGKKKNAVLRGGVLGAMAGLGAAFLKDKEAKPEIKENGEVELGQKNEMKDKILTVSLYTAGGLLAGATIQQLHKKNTKKKKKK